MSKIGKKPITIPQGITIKINDNSLEFKGKEGTIVLSILPGIKIDLWDNELRVVAANDDKQTMANWGTMRALAQNAVDGVNAGFTKELEIQGIGYRAAMEGTNLVLNVGFSHPIKFTAPAGVKVSVEKNFIKVFGADKKIVGQTAADIRAIKKPEPYKGKGIRYRGEVVRTKPGKKVVGTGTTATA